MLVDSFLVQGSGSGLAPGLVKLVAAASAAAAPLNGLALFSLGADHATLVDAVQKTPGLLDSCPVYLTETYGIIGFDDDLGRNIELMELGRGQEYGCRGGSGGQGCLAVAFSDGAVVGHDDSFVGNDNIASLLVVSDTSGAFLKQASSPESPTNNKIPIFYGGVSKQNWILEQGTSSLKPIPYFWVASPTQQSPIGISACTGDAREATKSLLEKMPSSARFSGSIGLFPCYTRGVNYYGKENVESQTICDQLAAAHAAGLPPKAPPRIFGMFAHGELGPADFAGFVSDSNSHIPCVKHSMTSILSIHTTLN